MGYLIDTCVWVDVEQGRLAPSDVASITADAPVYLSPVTIAELQAGVDLAADPDTRQRRGGFAGSPCSSSMERLLKSWEILPPT